MNLPVPGTLVVPTGIYTPPIIKGITIHPNDPLQMSFIINPGEENLNDSQFQQESNRLIKYFLASLTIPENELWVNLSPFEENRMVPESFGKTQMGLDLLAQDYMLKQLTSSMMYPEDETGKEFWKKVHQLAYEKFGTTEIPMNTFNKIWIVPEKAVVFEQGNSAVIVESKLKVLLEEDYLALENNQAVGKHGQTAEDADVITGVSLDVVREVLIPEIEKEINQGKTFSQLRQIYNAVILANWYKENLQESLIGQAYVDRNKTAGIETQDKSLNQKIYDQYVESFKKGVYNYIKEDYDPVTQQAIPRQYFSGGGDFTHTPDQSIFSHNDLTPRQLTQLSETGNRNVTVRLDNAMTGEARVIEDDHVFVERLEPDQGKFRVGSGAYIYGEKVVKANWYQTNLAFDLESVVQSIRVTGEDVVLDVSAGTGGASIYLLNRLREEGKRIKKLVLADVGYGQSRAYMEYARAALYQQFDDVVNEIEFYILPQTDIDSAGTPVFASVSDIPDLKADHIMMENAVHLIPKSQLVRTFKGIKDIMNPGATLTMGSGDIQGLTLLPENAVGVHQLFDFVGMEVMNLIAMDSKYDSVRTHYMDQYGTAEIREKKRSAFPTSNTQDDIYAALDEAGFGSILTGQVQVDYNQVSLERSDYKPFITQIQSYVQSRIIPELAKTSKTEDPFLEVREELVDRAYENVFTNPLEQFVAGYSLSWSKYTVINEEDSTSDTAMLAKNDLSEMRTANLAKKLGLIPHRDIEEEDNRFFSVNRWIKNAFDAGKTQTIDRKSNIRAILNDSRVKVVLANNGVDITRLGSLLEGIQIVAVEDLKNGSPALVMRKSDQYQVAHVGLSNKTIYIGAGLIQDLKVSGDEQMLDYLLLREFVAYMMASDVYDGQPQNYDLAVETGETKAEKIEKELVDNRLDEVIKQAVGRFLDRYYQDLLQKNVVWDYESSILDEVRGKELVGGKTYQQGVYWSDDPNNNLRSFGGTTTASTKFMKFHPDLLPQIDAILDNLDVADDFGRVQAEEQIRKLVVSYDIPEDIQKDLREAYTELVNLTSQELVAIRSSGKAEDNAYAFKVLTNVNVGSNAGQHDSYLGEGGEEATVRRWRDDISSLYTEQVLKYRDTLMVIVSFDEILTEKERAAEIIEKLNQSSNAVDLLVGEALRDHNFNIVTSVKLRDALLRNGFSHEAGIVSKNRKFYLDVENIAMGVTVMPMAGVDSSFVIMGHDIASEWTALGFQGIPKEQYSNRGRVATITTNYGIGESIVQGVTTPDSFLVHIFEDETGQHVNILNRQLGTKTVQAVYTFPVYERLGLSDESFERYLILLETGNVSGPLVGVKNGVENDQIYNVLQRLVKLTVDSTINEISKEDLESFTYSQEEVKLLIHLLKARLKDREIKTMFTDVSEEKRNSFSVTESQVIAIAKEFMKKAEGYGHLVDMEGAIGRNFGRDNTAVTVQRRPSNVHGDVKEANRIKISYTYVKEKDLESIQKKKDPVLDDSGKETGLILGQLVAQGIATRNSFSGIIYRITEDKSLPSQFEEIKALALSGEKIIIRTRETTPDYNAVLQTKNVMGVIADVGGATSHAAVMSRELGIATVVGIQTWVNKLESEVGVEEATKIINYINTTGNVVTVDANANEKTGFGMVYAGELPISKRDIEINLDRLPEIYTRIGYIMGMPHPMLAMSKISQYKGFSGVALMRGEFAYAEENINPRFGRAYDNLLVYHYLRTKKDNPPARRYNKGLSDAERAALEKFRAHLTSRSKLRDSGVEVLFDESELKIKEFEDTNARAFLESLGEYEQKDVELIREHSGEIEAATKQMLGYLSYNEFFEAVHGGAIASMAAANNVDDNTVLYRSIDFKKNEARELIGSIIFDPVPEVSTMIGERGARWLLQPENEIILREEIRMILRQVVRGYNNIGFFFPFVSTPGELDQLMNILDEEERNMSKQLGRVVNLREVGQMTELPSNVIQADEFIQVLKDHEQNQKDWFVREFGKTIYRKSFLSFGTNDLTQLTLGADRDNPAMRYLFSEAHPFVIESIRHVANIAKEAEAKCGLCGQALVNLVNINPEAAETILIMLGQTGGYAGTDYLGTLASIIRSASATLKHGVVDSPVELEEGAVNFAIGEQFSSTVSKGAATRPVYMVNGVTELGKSYIGDFVVLTGELKFELKESSHVVDGKVVVNYQVADEGVREKLSRLGAVIYGAVEHFHGQEKYIAAIEQLGVPVIRTQVEVTKRMERRKKDGDLLTIDFNSGIIFRDRQDVRVNVVDLASEIEVMEESVDTISVNFNQRFSSSNFHKEQGVHPLSYFVGENSQARKETLKKLLKEKILTEIKDRQSRLVYETFDLQSDDLDALDNHEAFLSEEVNPALGYSGLDALVNDAKWKQLFQLEMEVVSELMNDGYNIAIQLNSVKVPETIEKALDVITRVGIEIDSQVGMNTAWPGNYLFLEQFLDKGLSFVTLDERKLAQAYLSADLYKNPRVIDFYTKEKVMPNLRRPIAMIKRAAAERNVVIQTIDYDQAVKQDQSMLSEDFVMLLEDAIANPGEGESFQWEKEEVILLSLNKEYVLAHRAEFTEGIRALRESLLKERKINLESGLSFGALETVAGRDRAYVILAAGKLLGLWNIYPDDQLSGALVALTYQADPSGINYPAIANVNREAIGVSDAAMTANKKELGGIDLDPNLFEIERKGDGSLIFPKFNGSINTININGLIPVIINVTPINSLPLLLGFSDTTEDESNTISYDSLNPRDRKAKREIDQLSSIVN
ncbi:MAG: putative PEP-binding protein [Candidatus Omnitrophota bacterium]